MAKKTTWRFLVCTDGAVPEVCKLLLVQCRAVKTLETNHHPTQAQGKQTILMKKVKDGLHVK